jgi:endogenous inhibitor of DNA gyrase (YacG/DUF329 family)
MSPNAITKSCPICWDTFTATGRARHRIYCSVECKRTAAARREVERATHLDHPNRQLPAPTASAPTPLPQTVAHRDCPHCGGPITIVALLTTPEAARPSAPLAAPDGVIPLHR